jgi:hypothetical protein
MLETTEIKSEEINEVGLHLNRHASNLAVAGSLLDVRGEVIMAVLVESKGCRRLSGSIEIKL